MNIEYYRHYSPSLGRDMEMSVYGHAGRPVLYIPCQDGRFFDFDPNGSAHCFAIVKANVRL